MVKKMSAIRFFILITVCCILYTGCATLHETPDTPYAENDVALTPKGEVSDADEKDMTPLIRAVHDDQTEIIARLMEEGADIEEKDGNGKTAITYAYEMEKFDSFRLLLEKGAVFNAYEISAENGNKKKRFTDLASEYRLYQNILNSGEKTRVSDFEAYFSQFPKGYYATAAEAVFEAMVQKDFSRIGDPPDHDRLRAFIKKYADMGKNCYQITADSLNIRNSGSVSAPQVGICHRGDRFCALEENAEWIRTDRGWISKKYTRQLPVNIPKLGQYLDKAAEMAASDSPSSSKIPQKNVIFPKKSNVPQQDKEENTVSEQEKKSSQTDEIRGSDSSAVRRELDAILSHPELKTLEDFIRKYKDKSQYRSLVDSAREKYKKMLLEQ